MLCRDCSDERRSILLSSVLDQRDHVASKFSKSAILIEMLDSVSVGALSWLNKVDSNLVLYELNWSIVKKGVELLQFINCSAESEFLIRGRERERTSKSNKKGFMVSREGILFKRVKRGKGL
jgi:hypothetical protein